MGENNKMTATSGILDIGTDHQAIENFRGNYRWLKWYYGLKGFRFSDLRKHVLSRYNFVADQYPFRDLLSWYTRHMIISYENERCDVVNDNDYFSYCCKAERIDSKGGVLPRHLYPVIKFHPMSAFAGRKIIRFGVFTIDDLMERLSK